MSSGAPLLQDYLVEAARRLPHKVAVVCQERRVTYGELDARSNALAHELVRRGVQRGDRVLIFADNTPETVVAYFAALKANAVALMINALTKIDRLRFYLHDSRAVVMITDWHLSGIWTQAAQGAEHLRAVIAMGMQRGGGSAVGFDEALALGPSDRAVARTNLDLDLAAILYTSGTTGDPKGVMHTHRSLITATESIVEYLGVREDDVLLCVLPLSFGYGLSQMLAAFRAGARLVLERSFAFPVVVLKKAEEERVTSFAGVPTIFAMLTEMKGLADFDLSSLRTITNAAAALPKKHVQMLQQRFPKARIFAMYGQTECIRGAFLSPELIATKPSSVGTGIPNSEVWIVDEQGHRVGPGVVGQLVIRGGHLMRGYWERPEATAAKLRPGPVPGEVVLHTGDSFKLDEDGHLHFVARGDDIIKSRGEKVPPKDVEHALMNIHGIKEAAVIGVPDEILGQAIKAFVVLEQGVKLTEREIQRECQARLENFMVPKHVVFVPDLPKTDTGKVRKVGLS